MLVEAGGEGSDTISSAGSVDLNLPRFANTICALIGGGQSMPRQWDANLLRGNAAGNILTGGDGADTLDGGRHRPACRRRRQRPVPASRAQRGRDVIADFQTGAGGDVLDISDMLLGFTAGNEGQFVQCVASGGASIVRVDANGSAGGAHFSDVFIISGGGLALNTLIADGNLVLT
jgi:Ca2+-binding RTX toxin-like protein